MRSIGMLVLIAVLLLATAVLAQTDTPTPAPSLTPMPTPDTNQYWPLPTEVIEGTPQPAQWVAFGYSIDAGDVAMLVFRIGLLFSLWAGFIVWLLIRRKESKSLGGGR